jgi:hypothetical protein
MWNLCLDSPAMEQAVLTRRRPSCVDFPALAISHSFPSIGRIRATFQAEMHEVDQLLFSRRWLKATALPIACSVANLSFVEVIAPSDKFSNSAPLSAKYQSIPKNRCGQATLPLLPQDRVGILTSFRNTPSDCSFPLILLIDQDFTFEVFSSLFSLHFSPLQTSASVLSPSRTSSFPQSQTSRFDLACRKPLNICAGKPSSTMDVEKTACSQSCEVVPTPKPGSTRSQSCPSPTKEQDTSQKKGGDASENGSDESGDKNIKHNFRFLFCWFLGALTLTIPLILSATIFRTAHIKGVRLFGFFFWLAISWCSLLVSYIISWALGYCWFQLCQQEWRWFFSDDYETFMVDIRHSMMFFLWAITSWALVPLLCILDHRHCTDHWVTVLHKVLLVTFLCAIIFLVKSFLLERLFIKIAMETMTLRQKDLERSLYAIVVLLPIFNEPPSMKSRYEWVKAMRTWSVPQSSIENNLEQDNSDSPPSTPLPTHLPPTIPKNADVAQYVADIFQGNGSKEAYTALRFAIESTSSLRDCKLHNKLEKEHHRDSTTHVSRDGLYKEHVKAYLIDQLEKKKGHWHIGNADFSLALRQFKDIDRLWPILQDSRLDNEHDTEFVSFDSLAWMILYLGECLKEAVDGQKNLKMVVNSLDLRLTLFLCIPVAIIYGTL